MQELSASIREYAKKLLEEKKVDLIIGFEKGTLPLRSTPCFIRSADEVERLIWDRSCENNLANYLPRRKERVGIVAKGCDARSIVGLIKEGQIGREQVVIIGIPCPGMLDRRKIEAELDGKEVLEVEERDDQIVLKGHDFEYPLDPDKFLYQCCDVCRYRNPVIYDVLIGEKVAENEGVDPYAEVKEFESQSAEERWQYFSDQLSKCIRCYACRNACPMCYCKECFVECYQPRWVGKTTDLSNNQFFHLIRALHMAGRCTDCGACERACPMGIDLRKLTKKIEKDVEELFGYQAGMSLEEVPPLATFKPDDPEPFIR